VVGTISKVGDEAARTALYQAAHTILTRSGGYSSLKRWGMEVAKRRGRKRATVALARKLAVVLLRMWTSETAFRFGRPAVA
jgi:transposase